MGVRGLQGFLEPYGEPTSFPPLNKVAWLVIDGNALSYHIWNQQKIKNGDYRQFAKALLLFFSQLKAAKAETLQVCFDGSLPQHKISIRLMRMSRNVDVVLKNTGSLDTWAPTPAFSSYVAHQVLLEAGIPVSATTEEADLTCARAAAEFARVDPDRTVVFLISQDSDMFLFEMGTNVAYMPLNSISFLEETMTGQAYRYEETGDRIGVNLLDLGILMGVEGNDCKYGAKQAMRMLMQSPLMKHVSLKEIERATAMFNWLQPRTHTLFDTYFDGYNPSGNLLEVLSTGALFLPQQIENTKRPSSWLCSQPVRAQAYAKAKHLLKARFDAKVNGSHETGATQTPVGVREHYRQGRGMAVTLVMPAESDEIDLPAEGLTHQAIFTFAIRLLRVSCIESSHPMQEAELHAFVIMYLGTFANKNFDVDLNTIHLTSQYAGFIYSLLLLHECARVGRPSSLHKLYDLGTFLVALRLLQSGHSVYALAPGKEEEIDAVLALIRAEKT